MDFLTQYLLHDQGAYSKTELIFELQEQELMGIYLLLKQQAALIITKPIQEQ